MNQDLINIKKYYGEEMMRLCRNLFPSFLEHEGLLFELLEANFDHSKFLYEDLLENNLISKFKNYIYSLVDVQFKNFDTIKTPFELMREIGYTLYECKTEEDIQNFRRYYQKHEELCTFSSERLNDHYVFFAVKNDADKIKRENFPKPSRQDEYGTSVISIQFDRGKNNILSIKNRYNHTVDNPDATFSNNLDNIVEGLTDSFEKTYNLHINKSIIRLFQIPGYVKANDGKYYKYNYEINNVYYCVNNIIIDNFNVIRDYQEKEKYLVFDYFIIDLQTKKVILYDEELVEPFIKIFNNIKLIEIIKDNTTQNKKIGIVLKNDKKIYIEIDKFNRMVYYQDNCVKQIDNYFLWKNNYLKEVVLPNVVKINNSFMEFNRSLERFAAPSLKEIGNYFLHYNNNLEELSLPSLIKIGNLFLYNNRELKKISLPSIKETNGLFLYYNKLMKENVLAQIENNTKVKQKIKVKK